MIAIWIFHILIVPYFICIFSWADVKSIIYNNNNTAEISG